ncbi:LysR family transcriptional regulator [Pseudonocardia sp.]|uniref:LysR family transcriptional regulator n=1 Tax=Pseudonocardia sp. TaxID=60912 RepID=UPI00262EDF4F|nr:LysR family transcriptional regulator [Pseudonocardia sp.]
MTTNARLRAFVVLAECGSVRATAQALHVTEPSVSAAVGALARDVGVPLIEKDGRGVRLTVAGERYAGYARRILGLHAEAVAAARSEADPEHGLVRLAAVTTAGEHVLPDLLVSFRAAHPDVDLHLEVRARDGVWPMLAHHEVDLVVAGRPPAEHPGRVRAGRANTLVAVGAPGAVAGFAPDRTPWLLREPGSGTRATCLSVLAGLDTDPPCLTLGSHGAVVAAAVAGLGVTLVSEQAVLPLLAAGRLVVLPVPGTPLARPWHLVSAPRSTASAELFVRHVLERPEWSAS